MNTRKKTLGILFLLLFVIGAFTYFVYLNDLKRDAELKLSDMEDSYKMLQSHFLRQISQTEAYIKPDTPLFSPTENDSTLASLTLHGKRFCLYIERSQCEECWERALAYLEKETSNMNYRPSPIILASGYNRRDFLLMLERHHIKYPVYLLERPWEIEDFLSHNQPFYFILEKDGRMKSIFYPEGIYELMGERYLRHITAYCFPDTKDVHTNADIELLNPQVDLGKVPLRQKRIVELRIRNKGKQKCNIKNVIPTCNCVLVEGFPEAILPGETDTIRVSFLSTNKGAVEREVRVTVKGENTPYVFTITGDVV